MTNKHYSQAQRALSGLLAVLMVFTLTVSAFAADMSDFTDVPGHWAYNALEWAVDNGVLEGVTESSMAPNDHLTRAQMAAMTSRLYGTYKCAEISQYTDAAPESWYYSYIAQAVNMGTFTGYSQNRMGPGDNITREQAMTVLARMICLPAESDETLSRFSDRGSVASWAYDAVCGMVEREYVNGYKDGQLKPKEQITRAEMAQIMSNMFQSVHETGELTGTYTDTVLVRGDVNIHDAVFEGDLIIANGLRDRKLDLNNINVKGRLIVWGGSEVHINGNSTVSTVVTPRNDGPVKVIFDGTASGQNEQSCSIVYPDFMNKGNTVTFTEQQTIIQEVPKLTIDFNLPEHLYVGDSIEIKTSLTNADSVTWSLTKAGLGKPVDDLTKDGGKIRFTQEGKYVLTATAKNAGGTSVCEKTVEVLPVVGIAFSLPEYGHTDTPVDVELLLENGKEGEVSWALLCDGMEYPMPEGFTNGGGTLKLPDAGTYMLTASITDTAGKEYTARQSITVLPVIDLSLTSSADNVREDETAEISLNVENGNPSSIRWTLTCDGKEIPVSLEDNGGTLSFEGAGDYILTATAKDIAGREFESEPVSIHVIEKLAPALTSEKEKLHEDETTKIHLSLENGKPASVRWSMTCNEEEVPVTLDNDGGTLSFEKAGDYVLTAVATDELGKEFTETVSIKVYPVINLTLDIPQNTHADKPAAVHLTGNDLEDKTVVWSVQTQQRTRTPIDNNLGNDGGEISFPESGSYTLTASVTDELGRTFTVTGVIEVRDTMRLSFQLPAFSHTDETVKVKMTSEHLEENKIDWSLTVDGENINLANGMKGSLDNKGGSVIFTQTGTNVLTASVKDDLGREYTYQQTIEVYPVLTLELTADTATHTDEQINVSLRKDTSLPVTWKVTPSNDPNTAAAYNGTLSDNGGIVQIASAGTYDIAASVSDATGRVFAADTQSVTVYPVAGLSFTLPAAAWTDSSTPVDLLTTDLQGQDVTWTLTKDGKSVSLTDNMMGDLGNRGGTVRFPAPGTYKLTASIKDDLDREYSCTQTIKIYPVVSLTVSTKDMSHTDTAEDVKLTAENLGKNKVVWTVLRDGVEITTPFELNASGGHGFFHEEGLYTFTATVTDELGRIATASDSIQIYPVGISGFYLPKMFHTDSTVNLVTGFEELDNNPLHWTLTRNGEDVPATDYVTGELKAEGGKVQFKQAGDYKLKASFTDAGGRAYSYEQAFTVYPIPVVAWTMPKYGHTDDTFTVAVESRNVSDVEGSRIEWHLDDTYGLRQNWGTYVAGNLGAVPGNIRIKHAGIFTLGCEVTDATGRVFSFDGSSIEVLATQELQVNMIEEQVYTGEKVQVRTLGNNIELPVEWSIEKDGKPADMETYVTGKLEKLGGEIQFTEGGTYRVIGTIRDGMGRTFTSSDTIKVLPVGSLAFTMANREYVGNKVPVVMDKLFNPDGKEIAWSVQRDGAAYSMDLSTLDNDGGTVTFPEVGNYTLTATLSDSNGKTATASQSITIIYKASLQVTAPASIHIGKKFNVGISGAGSLDVSWGVKKGSKPVTLDSNTGFLSNDGGTLALFDEGTYTITATVRDDAGNLTSAFANITVTNTAPVLNSFIANASRTVKDGRYYADLKATCSDPDGDAVHLEWSSEYQADGYYEIGPHTIRVRAVDEWGATSAWVSRTIEFINGAPVITSFTATATRQTKGDQFFANVSAKATDPDGDTVKLEWDGDYSSSGWYSRKGSHTIRVRAVDSYGAASPWQEKTIEFVNQAPSKPVITKTPTNGVVRPDQAVKITAASTDPEGDTITYEWDGRLAESSTYPKGKQIIKCRAKDEYGAVSPWSAIVFFVADDTGGGMVLASANSFIEETGISFDVDGETLYGYITEYSFNVPAVSGHYGSDVGRIEAYNILTGKWEEVANKSTTNGVNLTGKLPANTYTQMRFYYDTNHDCMYNKSNITYTIAFDF